MTNFEAVLAVIGIVCRPREIATTSKADARFAASIWSKRVIGEVFFYKFNRISFNWKSNGIIAVFGMWNQHTENDNQQQLNGQSIDPKYSYNDIHTKTAENAR